MGDSKLKCSRCTQTLACEEFHPRKSRPRGYDSHCKGCRKKQRDSLNRPPAMIGFKTCCRCNEHKHVTQFFASKCSVDGREGQCKQCEHKRKMHRLNTFKEIRIVENLRRRVRAVLAGENKSANTLTLIGCSPEALKKHIEQQFTEKMSWDNYGEWHIDHIRPCASFDLTNPQQQSECFNYRNLQPLWAEDNLKKADKV